MEHWWERPIHRRAPAGGELRFDDLFAAGGTFEPFYVPRRIMPQVDQADYDDLLRFAHDRGVEYLYNSMYVSTITPHQRIEHDALRKMTPENLLKPILVSADQYILDGHHRWYEHRQLGPQKVILAYQFDLTFEAAVGFLFSFSKTYSYGDGLQHPEAL